MEEQHAPQAPDETATEGQPALATSLTDLIDAMDRAAFHRSLASRDQATTAPDISKQPKRT